MAASGGEEIAQMISVYEQRGIEKGIQQGMERGVLRGKQETLLRQIQRRFGNVPEGVTARIEAIASSETLDRRIDQAIEATSLAEIGLIDG